MSTAHFTTRQLAYIDARVAGHGKKESAIHAGYSPAGADRQATQLEKLPKVKRAIAAGKRKVSNVQDQMEVAVNGGRPGRGGSDESRMKPKYASSLDLLQHTYNNPKMPDSVRLRAAEQALPYEHGRVGEKGKKENAKDRAREVAGNGGKKPKFGHKAPPPLKVVGGTG
jgi:phage terminase small subunit